MPANLAIADYDTMERRARGVVSNIEIMAFQPVTFARIGYPTHVAEEAELASYVDLLSLNSLAYVPYDTGKFFRGASLYASYSPDEADLLNDICDRVVALTRDRFGKPVRPIINSLTQIGMFRVVQAIAALLGKPSLRIFEIGPGFGYLGCFLGLQGHTYTSMDVTQGLYLWQNRLLEGVFGAEFTECAAQEDPSGIGDTRITHIPWWHFSRLYKAPPSYDIIIANGVWGEMSSIALQYTARLCKDMLAHAECPLIVFNNFGNPLQTSPEGVAAELNKHGFEQVLDEMFYGFSTTGSPARSKLGALARDVPLFRPSGRKGELGAHEFMTGSWDEAPDSLAINSYITGWAPPILAKPR